MWVVQASAALAPGGYAAFGDDGLSAVTIPVMIFGGTLDEWTPLEYEIRPIYGALESTAWKVDADKPASQASRLLVRFYSGNICKYNLRILPKENLLCRNCMNSPF